MKNKISFTSVLKSKSGSRQVNLSSAESQQKQHRLIDIYQEFESNPSKNYTLELNAFRTMAHRSRNSNVGIGMVRSNFTNEDPQNNLDAWIETQKKQNYESFTKGHAQKSFKGALSIQQEQAQNRRSRSNFNHQQMYPQHEEEEEENYQYQTNQMMESSKRYQQTQMEESQKTYQRNSQKPQLHFHSQSTNEIQNDKALKQKNQNQQSSSMRPEQFLVSEQLKPKSHFPNIEDQDYKKLQEEFERLKSEKIAELCMQTKKSVKREKLEQIISKALENIYQDIEQIAEQIIMQRKIQNIEGAKRQISQEEVSQEMLISGCNDYQSTNQLNEEQQQQLEEVRRQEEIRNKIKCYISGIQEAKNQGKGPASIHSSKGIQIHEYQHQQSSNTSFRGNTEESQEPSFNYHSNTHFNHSKENESELYGERKQSSKSSIPVDSVGYSFANSNMICEHSFNKELMDHNNIQNQFHQNEENYFQKNHVRPPIYQPENSDIEQEQRISLPNIEEVKSDCGDFPHEQLEIESSEEIEFRRNKMQNITLDITGNNIKNIESVHYEPPAQPVPSHGFEQSYQRKDLFKNFEPSASEPREQEMKNVSLHNRRESTFTEKDEILRQQNITCHQEQKFVSKTFSSYLSGQMRPEYGQAIKQISRDANESSYSSKQSGFGYKIEPIARYSPSTNKLSQEKILHTQKVQNQNNSFHSISSPREQSFVKTMNNSIKNQSLLNSNKISSNLNESLQQSLNHSINQPYARQEGISPKNIHQLESKAKFSINSPMNKIDEILLNEEKQNRENPVTEFNGFSEKIETSFQFNKLPSSSNSYAVSSSIGDNKSKNIVIENATQVSQNQMIDHKYACAQSINESNQFKTEIPSNQSIKFNQNSLLSMQPLKLSNEKDKNEGHYQIKSRQSSSPQNISYSSSKTAVSEENSKNFDGTKIQTFERQITSSNISNGRTFLQSLHEKQSIQIQLSPESKKDVVEGKTSFVAQTFRPTPTVTQEVIKPLTIATEPAQLSSHSRTSITKITLRSSDKTQVTSPKVISLSINQFSQKPETVKQNIKNEVSENKENVFEKLTIKQSKNFGSSNEDKNSISNNYQTTKTSQTSNTLNHVDINSKENNNTMNNSVSKYDKKAEITVSEKAPALITEKREPLLKLSKNFGYSTQQSINVKKSIGESIRTKVHPPSSLANSKGLSMMGNLKHSIKDMKQSIGNDSDMDFDLELD